MCLKTNHNITTTKKMTIEQLDCMVRILAFKNCKKYFPTAEEITTWTVTQASDAIKLMESCSMRKHPIDFSVVRNKFFANKEYKQVALALAERR